MTRMILLTAVGLVLSACDKTPEVPKARWTDTAAPSGAPVKLRWYTREQVVAGAPLYQENCATCHKENAEGTADWKTRDANGQLPPPPLNGTAHTWHHSLKILRTVVRSGGAPVGGTMPAFGQKITAEQIDAILAWVQSHWSDEIYGLWQERERQSGLRDM